MKRFIFGFGILVLTGSLAVGQVRERPWPGPVIQQPIAPVHRLSHLIGAAVTAEREVLGRVKDVVLNEDGCMEYLVIDHRGSSLFVPWSVANVDFPQRAVRINVPLGRLGNLTVQGERWPDFTSPEWRRRITEAFGGRFYERHYYQPRIYDWRSNPAPPLNNPPGSEWRTPPAPPRPGEGPSIRPSPPSQPRY